VWLKTPIYYYHINRLVCKKHSQEMKLQIWNEGTNTKPRPPQVTLVSQIALQIKYIRLVELSSLFNRLIFRDVRIILIKYPVRGLEQNTVPVLRSVDYSASDWLVLQVDISSRYTINCKEFQFSE
jgi:hypothetical protein